MRWRWIPPLTADASLQMAIDRWMLQQQCAGQGDPMLRLYQWSRPTLSLGRHQRQIDPRWIALAEQGRLHLVRRPSGGRAVLHAGELTYALACRPATTHRLTAYAEACQWLQEAFAALGVPLEFGSVKAAEAAQRGNCFASGTAADLVQANGAKRIGSAQLWSGACLLQHGSVLLSPPQDLWREVFNSPAPSLEPLPQAAVMAELQRAARDHLCGGALQTVALSAREWQQIQLLEDPAPLG